MAFIESTIVYCESVKKGVWRKGHWLVGQGGNSSFAVLS